MISNPRFSLHDENFGCSRRHVICNTSFLVNDLPSWSWVTRPGRQDLTFGTGRCATASREQTPDVANTSGLSIICAHTGEMAHLSACAVDLNRVPAYIGRDFHTLNLEQELVGIIPAPSMFKAAGALRSFTISSRCILPNAPANLLASATPIYQTHLAINCRKPLSTRPPALLTIRPSPSE